MKKKGFTLIELLAVIVILAIIALIATPIVMNVIENSRKGAAERSAENYLDAVETAIMEARLDGTILADGTYSLAELEADDKLGTIEVSGNKPTEGSVKIQDGVVVIDSNTTLKVGDYTVSYDADGKIFATKEQTGTNESYICKKTGEASKTVGAEYSCVLGDNVPRTFYVLENIESSENISLIMDRNFTDGTVQNLISWCIDGGTNNTCKNINSKEDNPLKHIQDTFGDNVEVSFPTYDQIVTANNGSEDAVPQWLHYIDDPEVSGYWTASPNADNTNSAWYVAHYGDVRSNKSEVSSADLGVRPVITISKNQLD